MEAAAKSNLKRVSLELGGKSPLIIFGDVDGKIIVLELHSLLNKIRNCVFRVECAILLTFRSV